jgi:hypothetical protein
LKKKKSKAPLAFGEGPGVRFFRCKNAEFKPHPKSFSTGEGTFKKKKSNAPLACGEEPGVRFFRC